ncbi:hypothetical protein BaRGS_00035382 [Batillaria attramentaria]|uniref:Reverse transcriptase domain-containing protein n=1 Tax=Batillaria attramentaria TaxID=370345 RepID=A0ABD0JE40_9CAEN
MKAIITNYTTSQASLFVDDILLHCPIQSISDHLSHQADLVSLAKWADQWEVRFNITCFAPIIFSVNMPQAVPTPCGAPHDYKSLHAGAEIQMAPMFSCPPTLRKCKRTDSSTQQIGTIWNTTSVVNTGIEQILHTEQFHQAMQYIHLIR